MTLTLDAEHIKRYKDIARLLLKYGRDEDMLAQAGLDDALSEDERSAVATTDPKAEELADDLERMGPIYIKLGQVLSSRADLLPPAYLQALSRLQDRLRPFPFSEVEEIIEQELGVRLSKAFSGFEPAPIATASLGQVHRATFRDGRPVAVKVQRPGIRAQIAQDLEVLADITAFVDEHTTVGEHYRFREIFEEFRASLIRELDYRREAHNLVQLGDNLKDFPRILVPQPVDDYTTSRVLTMDYVRGKKVTTLGPLARMEMDGPALADELFRAYLKQILVDGLFHADPHPGNVFITDDGRIALLDLGMVGHLTPSRQEQLLKLLMATGEGDSERAADLAIQIGELQPDFEETEFRRRVADIVLENQDLTAKEMQLGRVMLSFSKVAGDSGIRLPTDLTMLGKTLLNLDEIARTLAPEINPNESIRRHVAEIVRRRTLKSLSPGNVIATAMEAKEFAEALPGRVNHILDALAKNQFKLHVEAFDENTLMEGFQKVANRIATGLVLAALIIGAAMLMRVETHFQLFGYPGFAMLCFLAAAGGGAGLIVSILLNDRHARKKRS